MKKIWRGKIAWPCHLENIAQSSVLLGPYKPNTATDCCTFCEDSGKEDHSFCNKFIYINTMFDEILRQPVLVKLMEHHPNIGEKLKYFVGNCKINFKIIKKYNV